MTRCSSARSAAALGSFATGALLVGRGLLDHIDEIFELPWTASALSLADGDSAEEIEVEQLAGRDGERASPSGRHRSEGAFACSQHGAAGAIVARSAAVDPTAHGRPTRLRCTGTDGAGPWKGPRHPRPILCRADAAACR